MCGKTWDFIYRNYLGIEFRNSSYCQLLYQDIRDSGTYVLELSQQSSQWLTQITTDGCYIWKSIDKYNLVKITNPPVQVENYFIDDQTQINVFQDGVLTGGTKQRALIPLLQTLIPQYNEFIYAGHIIGYAYAAISYGCWLLGVKSTSFVQGTTKTTSYDRAIYYGGTVKKYNQSLRYVQEVAETYAATRPNAYLFPLGFSCDIYQELLHDALVISLPPRIKPKRLWVIAGSGTLLRVFGKIWPNTQLLAVLVGKSIWEDQFDPQVWKRITIYKAPQRYGDRATLLPPYSSVSNYDAKIWQFVLQYGQSGDYIWNVAAE